MQKKIEALTEKQWKEVDQIRERWMQSASKPLNKQKAREAVAALYGLRSLPCPEIVFVSSPATACVLVKSDKNTGGNSLRNSLRDSLWNSLWDSLRNSLRDSLWDSLRNSLNFSHWKAFAAFLEGGKLAGVQYDWEKYRKFQLICESLFWIWPYRDVCIVAEPPYFIGWRNGVIHAEDRAAVEYVDGFKVWAIEGVRVDEQIVMRPGTQTIEQIRAENNEEVRRIRINRYGWTRYLTEANANVLDINQPAGGWLESLMQCDEMTVLCTYDPSTGRPYALEVDSSCVTCEQAQRYLLAPDVVFQDVKFKNTTFDTKKIKTYPILRT